MRPLFFILCSTICAAQTHQYTKTVLSKKTGKEVTSYSEGYGILYDAVTKKQGIVDSLGNITFESPYKGSIYHIFKNKFVLSSEEGNRTKSGIIDEKGNEIISLNTQDFNTPWLSKERIICSKGDKEAVYDYSGKLIIPFSDRVRLAAPNRFFVLKDKQWFLYDFNGNRLNERGFKKDYNFENCKALIINDEDKNEIIGPEGQTLHTFTQYIVDITAYPFLITKNKTTGKYGLIDTEENIIADEIFSEITPEYFGNKEYIYLRKNNKTTVFHKKDKKLYPGNFKYLNSLSGQFFSVYNDKLRKYGVTDIEGNLVVPQEYDFIRNFSISGHNFIYLKNRKEEKLLDKDLKNRIDTDVKILAFYPDNLIVNKQNKYYRFSVNDQSMAELKNITLIKGHDTGYFNPLNLYSKPVVCQNNNRLYGVLDGKGKEIIPFIYEDIIVFENSENEFIVKKDGKYGVLNFQNEPLREIIYDKYFWQKEVLRMDYNNTSDFIYFTRFKGSGAQF
ncbi:WG repeat-containing protein [Chryseobacterium flavum]|uniref:WG repeat-containing protein n=1 Tax=Chryseobacterium flavum TaxID=415851 RepID=UPI0028ABDDCA|nr:WG repeat-containing protein [Chryseobacterium flavum]